MNTKLILSAVALVFILSFTAKSSHFFTPSPIPNSKDLLHSSQTIHLADAGASGLESMAFEPAGEGPYTGVADGWILKSE
ncbi:hypothetical protein LguiA_020545 [Lonicera macranthoides]